MLYGAVVLNDLPESVYSHLEMVFNIVLGYNLVAFLCLDTFRNHWLVGDKKESAGRNMVCKTADEKRAMRASSAVMIVFLFIKIFPVQNDYFELIS